jgi:predicted nucleotide-binding protein
MPDENPEPSRLESIFGSRESILGSSSLYPPAAPGLPSKIFIVHGHDHGLTYELVLALRNAGLDVITFEEGVKQGRTISEKLHDLAGKAGFAVVLLTADDVGGEKQGALQPRARQNVVFEMGLFIGLLGRDKVCAVYEPSVELPSDLQGILYVKHDPAGKWKYDVAKEIAAAGIEVDFRKL